MEGFNFNEASPRSANVLTENILKDLNDFKDFKDFKDFNNDSASEITAASPELNARINSNSESTRVNFNLAFCNNKGKMVKPEKCEGCPAFSFSIFCDPELKKLLDVGDHRVVNVYKRGQTLFVQGNPPYGLYCLSSGKIKVSNVGPDGRESIVRIAVAGDILGHRSMFTGQYYMGTATAIEDSVVCFIDKKFVEKLMADDPRIAHNIISKMGRDLGRAEKMVASFSQKNVPERLAELLLNLRMAYGVQDGSSGKWRLDIKLTREEMASMIGTASETLIRFLSEFKEDGLIEQQGKVIYITDLSGLMEIGHLTEEHLW
ncbi:MAG: Crp/Fnr family transcriptional regulator [Oligoflexia bacterium]|nr:Crp/Fnr family transcriptional regulator [Oligoflexia bacterium]